MKVPAIPREYLWGAGLIVAAVVAVKMVGVRKVTSGVISGAVDGVTDIAAGVIDSVSPANDQNVINQTATKLLDSYAGEGSMASVWDHVFAAGDLLNPFAPDYRRDYAKKVWGW